MFGMREQGSGRWWGNRTFTHSLDVLRLMHLTDRGWKRNFTRFGFWPLLLSSFFTLSPLLPLPPSQTSLCSGWFHYDICYTIVVTKTSFSHKGSSYVLNAISNQYSQHADKEFPVHNSVIQHKSEALIFPFCATLFYYSTKIHRTSMSIYLTVTFMILRLFGVLE